MDQTHATETHLEETKPNPRKKILLLCCLVAAILVVAYCVLCGMAGRGTIYPNVTISGVNVGGLTKQEAQTALEKAVQKQAPDESRGVVFAVRTAEGEEKVVEVPLSSVATDYAASHRPGLAGGKYPVLWSPGRCVSEMPGAGGNGAAGVPRQ